MPRLKTLTLAMSAVFLAAGCASSQTAVNGDALPVQALQRVTHGQNNPQALYQLGRYYHGQARYAQALDAYRQALSLQPRHVDALTGMGVAYASLGDHDAALRLLVAAASLDPASVTAQNNLGYIHWLRGERDGAMQAYRAALKLDPMNERARDNLRLAMKDAANEPAPVADARPEAADDVARAEPAADALEAVAPQVYALRAPSAPSATASTPVAATAVVPAPVTARVLALSEVAPQVFALHMPAQAPQTVSSRPAAAPVPVQDAPLQAVAASPAAPVAAGAVALEVMNGNGVKGLANSVTRYLAAKGYPTLGAGNQPRFDEARTRIEYAPGEAEQARRLGALLPRPVALSEVAGLAGQAKIRLVLGKDLRQAPDGWTLAAPAGTVPAGANGLPLAVANGNGVKGMARKVADFLAGRGFRTAGVYDLRPFDKAVTRIEYRTGHKADAIRVGDQLPGKVAYVESPGLHTGVRLVLGHDIKHDLAAWSPWLEGVKLAQADAAGGL